MTLFFRTVLMKSCNSNLRRDSIYDNTEKMNKECIFFLGKQFISTNKYFIFEYVGILDKYKRTGPQQIYCYDFTNVLLKIICIYT